MDQTPGFADHVREAQQFAGARDWSAAAEHYARAFPLDPSSALLVQYGHMLKEGGFLDRAAAAYRAALSWDGTDTDALLHLGHLLKRLGQRDAALETFRTLARIPGAPHVQPEIDGLVVAGLNVDHKRLAAPAAVLPEAPAALAAADADLVAWLTAARAERQAAFEAARAAALPQVQKRSGRMSRATVEIQARVVPSAHLVIEEGVHRATTGRPRMRLEIPEPLTLTDLEDGWIELTLAIEAPGRHVDPVLLIEHDPGWADFTVVRLGRLANGKFRAIFFVRAPVVSIRLDPFHAPGTFSISEPRLLRLSRTDVAMRAVRSYGTKPVPPFLQALVSSRGKDVDGALEACFPPLADDPYARWIDEIEAAGLPEVDPGLACPVRIGWLLPVSGPDPAGAIATLASLKAQTRADWTLQVLLAASVPAKVRDALVTEAAADPRIGIVPGGAESVAARLNAGAENCGCDVVGHLEPGDRLSPDAMARFAAALAARPDTRILYCDDDQLDETGKRQLPRFKPDWNADYYLGHDYIGRAALLSVAEIRRVGGYRDSFPGREDQDLILRVALPGAAETIGHLAHPLWHCPAEPTPADSVAVVADHLARNAPEMRAVPGRVAGTVKRVWPMPASPPQVTLIIPTRDRIDLLETAVRTLLTGTDYPAFDILIVDNGSVEPESLTYLAGVGADPRVSVLRDDGPFNFSRLNNRAAEQAKGSVLGLVNNDIAVIESGWLTEMVSIARDPTVGAVGATLLYGSGHVQHAGMLGGVGAYTGHGHKFRADGDAGYMNRLVVQQTVLAVTGACLVVEAEKYRAVGGLDEENFRVAFNDTDLCLKLADRGWRTVFTPWARLHHHESLSRGLDLSGEQAARFRAEGECMVARWGDRLLRDPLYSPNLTHRYEDFALSIVDRL